MVRHLFIGLAVLTCGLSSAFAAHDCGSDQVGSRNYTYCIDQQDGAKDGNVIVFMHGLAGDESSWLQQFSALDQALTAKNGVHPTVITISFGPEWLLSQVRKNGEASLYDVFVKTALPAVESKLGRPVTNRILLGQSMGGFNGIQLMTMDTKSYSKFAVVCPAIATLSPFASQADIGNFITAHRPFIDDNLVKLQLQIAQEEFPTAADWNESDPLLLVKRINKTYPPIYVSSGTHDQFGFYDGSLDFANDAKAQGANVTWVSILNGDHCTQTAQSLQALTAFLANK